MALNYSKILALMALVFFIAAFGFSANAGIYNYNYYVCCTGYYADYYSVGVYNAQGDPSYLRYDPYAYQIDPYQTRSIPSYPYTYTYYPAYGYVGSGYSYSPYVYSAYPSYVYPVYQVRTAYYYG